MEQSIVYVGLDVHKDTVALAEAGLRGKGFCRKFFRGRGLA